MTALDTRRRDLLLSCAIPAGLLLLSFLLIRFSYEANDDLGMIAILNGSYTGTPDARSVFLKYPLSWLISTLYKTGIQISWYQVTMMAICALAIGSILYRLLKRLPRAPAAVCALTVGGVCWLWLPNIMRFTFTTCSGFLAASLVLCYALQSREEELRPGLLANLILLFLLSYCVRDQFTFIALAFLGVIWLSRHWNTLFRDKRCWLVPLSALIALGCTVGIHEFAYRDWAEFYEYNEDRAYLQDYGNFPSYEENEALLRSLGYDQVSYFALSHYDYSLLEDFDPQVIHTLGDYARSQEQPEGLLHALKRSLRTAVDFYFVDSLSQVKPLQAASYLLPALLLAAGLAVGWRKKDWPAAFFSLLLLFGMGCCYLMIGYRNRYPSRVASSLRIIVICASLAGLALLLQAHPIRLSPGKAKRWLTRGIACVLVLAAVAGFGYTRMQRGAPKADQYMAYIDYINQYPDNIYIRDIRSTQYKKELLSEYPKVSYHVIGTGGWSSYSPIFYEKLEAMGLETLNRETLYQENVYLIVSTKYSLNQILGVSQDTQVDYEVVQEFDDGIQILKIHSIGA